MQEIKIQLRGLIIELTTYKTRNKVLDNKRIGNNIATYTESQNNFQKEVLSGKPIVTKIEKIMHVIVIAAKSYPPRLHKLHAMLTGTGNWFWGGMIIGFRMFGNCHCQILKRRMAMKAI